jgi:hypothetical protein
MSATGPSFSNLHNLSRLYAGIFKFSNYALFSADAHWQFAGYYAQGFGGVEAGRSDTGGRYAHVE